METTYGVFELIVEVLDNGGKTTGGHVQVMVKTLSGLVVTVVVLGLGSKLILHQCQDFRGMEEGSENSGGHFSVEVCMRYKGGVCGEGEGYVVKGRS